MARNFQWLIRSDDRLLIRIACHRGSCQSQANHNEAKQNAECFHSSEHSYTSVFMICGLSKGNARDPEAGLTASVKVHDPPKLGRLVFRCLGQDLMSACPIQKFRRRKRKKVSVLFLASAATVRTIERSEIVCNFRRNYRNRDRLS